MARAESLPLRPIRVALPRRTRSTWPSWTRCPTPPSCWALALWASAAGPGLLSAQRGVPTGGALPGVESDALPGVESDTPPGSHLEVLLMTIGPGDEVWERFSHNALVVRDDRAETELAYNWGLFDFNDVDFIPRLARGRMRYSMAGFPASAWLAQYRRANRDVWLQTVNLTPGQRLEVQRLVTEMDTDANRYYRYDYYRDNCSTRVRDVLDRVLGGQIRAATEDMDTGTTYRWHTARLLQSAPIYYAGIQFVVGNRGDETISAWEEMFLPLRLKEHLDGVRILDVGGEPGPLLGEAVQVVGAVRDPLPPAAPNFLLPLLLVGMALGAFFGGLGWVAGEGKRWGRWALALSGATWSAVVGFLGTALLLSWLFTDHVFWTLNENAFLANPASLLLAVVLAALLVREVLNPSGVQAGGQVGVQAGVQVGGRAGVLAGMRVDVVAKVVGGLAIAGFLVQVLPGFDQINGEVMAVLLPAHVGLAWGVLRAWPPSMA